MPYSSQWRRLGEAGFLILIRGDGEQQPKVMAREDMQRVPVVVEARHAGDRVNADHLDAIQSKSLSLQTNLSALLRSGFVSPSASGSPPHRTSTHYRRRPEFRARRPPTRPAAGAGRSGRRPSPGRRRARRSRRGRSYVRVSGARRRSARGTRPPWRAGAWSQ
jgi:hypothetical protein